MAVPTPPVKVKGVPTPKVKRTPSEHLTSTIASRIDPLLAATLRELAR